MVIKNDHSKDYISKKNKNYKFIENLRSAPFLDRVAAFIIDYFIILSPVATLFLSPFKKQLGLSAILGDGFNSYVIYFNIAIVIFTLSLFYNFLFTYFFKATLGQIFMRLKVESVVEEEELGLFDSILRAFIFTGSLFLLGLPFLLVLTHKARRSLHGLVSDTYVYSTNLYKKTKISSVLFSRLSLVFGVVIAFFITLTVVQTVLGFRGDAGQAQELALCEEVTEALESWPEQTEVQPQRLSVAMALYAIEGANRDCLKKEVNYVFESGEDAGLAYLANAFVHSDNAEVSDSYLEKVCELEEKSETCMMSKVIDNWATDNLDLVKYTLKRIKGDSVYVNLWKSRFLISEGEYDEAFNIIAQLPKIKAISSYTSVNKAKLYWFKGKFEQAKIITDMILEKEISSDSNEIASWICSEELEKSCSEQKSSSCKYIDKKTKKGALAGVATLKSLECDGQLTAYHKYNWASEPEELIKFKLDKIGDPKIKLINFLANKYKDQRIPHIAVSSFLEGSPQIDDGIYERIKDYTNELPLKFERLKLSETFLGYLVNNEYYDYAYGFGEQLLDKNSSNGYKENLIISAYLSGDKDGAKRYLNELGVGEKSIELNRGIASSSKFNFVKKLIKGDN